MGLDAAAPTTLVLSFFKQLTPADTGLSLGLSAEADKGRETFAARDLWNFPPVLKYHPEFKWPYLDKDCSVYFSSFVFSLLYHTMTLFPRGQCYLFT